MAHIPKLTASGEVIYGETPEDGIIAKVYGDSELAKMFAAAPALLEALEAAPDLSKYRGTLGFAEGRFIVDYGKWAEKHRAAIAAARGE